MAHELLVNQVPDPDLGSKDKVMARILSGLQLQISISVLLGNTFRFTCVTL